MAIINQDPTAQVSVNLSSLSVDNVIVSGTPVWQGRKIVENSSVAVAIGSTGASSLPTTGQIWPSKL